MEGVVETNLREFFGERYETIPNCFIHVNTIGPRKSRMFFPEDKEKKFELPTIERIQRFINLRNEGVALLIVDYAEPKNYYLSLPEKLIPWQRENRGIYLYSQEREESKDPERIFTYYHGASSNFLGVLSLQDNSYPSIGLIPFWHRVDQFEDILKAHLNRKRERIKLENSLCGIALVDRAFGALLRARNRKDLMIVQEQGD